jgi:hypothetical protein
MMKFVYELFLLSVIPIQAIGAPIVQKDPMQARDMVIHPRASPAQLNSTGNALQNVGTGLGIAGGIADAIPGGEIVGTALDVVSTVLDLIGQALDGIAEEERESAAERGNFTQNVVSQTLPQHPGWLVVIVKPDHYFYGQGVNGTDWATNSTSITTSEGTIDFDIYAARAGVFMNNGDGGYMNWAYGASLGSALTTSGFQNHRLTYTGGGPKNSTPASGQCGMHLYQYRAKSKYNPEDNTVVVAILKDANGMIVGFAGDGNADAGFAIDSALPYTVDIKSGTAKDSLSFAYAGDNWLNTDSGRCSNGGFDKDVSQKDCTFQCTFK